MVPVSVAYRLGDRDPAVADVRSALDLPPGLVFDDAVDAARRVMGHLRDMRPQSYGPAGPVVPEVVAAEVVTARE